jgi:2-(1,2-epoxy-1,2-dihydrophenyl)acetyl-CoA isomerase
VSIDVEQREDGITVVTINWPERRNALGPDDTRQLGEALAGAAETSVIGTILTGAGAFCAGGDLEQFANLSARFTVEEIRDRIYGNVHSVLRAIRRSPVPVAAAVDGPAVGLGLDYALACDMCFVGPKGWLQQGWAVAGLIHGAGGSAFLQRSSGPAFWRLVAGQQRLDGPAAASLGVAEAVDHAVDAAVEQLRELGRLPREVLEAYTQLFREEKWPDAAFFDQCADFQARFIGSERFRDRARSILAQRERRAMNHPTIQRTTDG